MRRTICLLIGMFPVATFGFDMPQGCTGLGTIQHADCMLSHYYTCAADAPGDVHRVDVFDTGPGFTSRTDSEGRWVESHDLTDLPNGTYLGPETDPASLTDLLEQGVDTFDFTTSDLRGERLRFRGFDRLTGAEITLGGQRLLETTFRMEVETPEGRFLWRSEGQEYVHPGWRVFVAGKRTVSDDNTSYERDSSPMQLSTPTDPGFLAPEPIFGCTMHMAALTR